MARKNSGGGKRTLSFFSKKSRSAKKSPTLQLSPIPNSAKTNNNSNSGGFSQEPAAIAAAGAKGTKKKAGSRLWMRFDRSGQSEILEYDKSAIIRHASIPARDLRILGPIFSHSSNILAREKAMVVNLEFIKAIVTADEVLLLDPLSHEVLPFVDQLRQQIPFKSSFWAHGPENKDGASPHANNDGGEGETELPFEFQVLEVALEVVCSYLDSSVGGLEKDAYHVLDELAMNVSTKNLERVRSLKSNLTRLLARVQKVRDEV